jgi:RND superfamily putative drug exporter
MARSWLVIAAWLVVGAAVIGLSPRIGTVTTSDQSSFLPASAESTRATDLARRAFPDTVGASGVLVITGHQPLTAADTATITRLSGSLHDPSVLAVLPPSVSANGAVALLTVQFDAPAQDARVRDGVTAVRAQAATALAGTGLTAAMTGPAAIAVDNTNAFARAEKIVTAATAALILVLLLVVFRSPVAALLPLLTVGLVFGIAESLVALAATVFHFKVGQELPTMLTVVLFGIGTDYILFVLFRYRERLRAGDPPRAAIATAIRRVREAIGSAGFAVVAAFGALVLAALGFFTTLGPALAIGVLVMLAAALTLVPAAVTVLGGFVFWPARAAVRPRRSYGFPQLGRLVASRPAAVLLAGGALVAGLGMGVLAFHADYDPIDQLPAGTESTRAFDQLKLGFPAGALSPTDVYLSSVNPISDATVGAFATRLADLPGVATPLPARVAADRRTVDIPIVLSQDPYGSAALQLVYGPLRTDIRALAPPGTTTVLGGQTVALADIQATTARDLKVIFPVAGVLFVLILGLLLRAALAPVYLVVLVVGAFAATLGACALLFPAGLAFSIPIVVYLFVTAIGTDYNILVMARIREELRDGRAPREAARLAITHAGPSVAAAALLLGGTFASLTISGVPFFVQIGVAVTLGIALVSGVVSLLLVPALTTWLGRVAWWPGTRDTVAEPMIVESDQARAASPPGR